jgi:hypothetical protein
VPSERPSPNTSPRPIGHVAVLALAWSALPVCTGAADPTRHVLRSPGAEVAAGVETRGQVTYEVSLHSQSARLDARSLSSFVWSERGVE